ncbi:hypothetical protein M3201_10775 [Paenibacillus motobuensis]|uniref:hypothetical protein n=1 Tax=Paenibacillus TaxID=44249 RepID=UPI00203CFC99|nr:MULTISPECIES: hypothetical protein [Paenibacillus]MCM3040180.1 hypothetical protein [Paenibacillus lutimineralis]MCM3647284.1 hypothetical protein [Paenibacillus motobuensis]
MSERLSRVERYERSRETKHTKTRHRRSSEARASRTGPDFLADYQKEEYEDASRDETLFVNEVPDEVFKEQDEADGTNMKDLPTRKQMFPSQRLKLQKWFLNSLLYIFIGLLVFLLWWGISESPWGQKYGL